MNLREKNRAIVRLTADISHFDKDRNLLASIQPLHPVVNEPFNRFTKPRIHAKIIYALLSHVDPEVVTENRILAEFFNFESKQDPSSDPTQDTPSESQPEQLQDEKPEELPADHAEDQSAENDSDPSFDPTQNTPSESQPEPLQDEKPEELPGKVKKKVNTKSSPE
ncbi:MAG: hypothetical protein RR202_10510 [Bacteroidales bacterium]